MQYEGWTEGHYTIISENVKEKSFILYCLGVLYSFISPERFDKT